MSTAFQPGSDGGRIELVLGPMFSGKTTELIRRIRRHIVAKNKCLLVKFKGDTRYSETGVATHDKAELDAKACTLCSEVQNLSYAYNIIAVDEGQFFPDLVEHAEKWANQGKVVIIAALDGDFQRQPFGSILSLIPLAETVIKLSAVCTRCRKDAAFTRRLGTETTVELVGGAEMYTAMCRTCYLAAEAGVSASNQQLENMMTSVPKRTKRNSGSRMSGGFGEVHMRKSLDALAMRESTNVPAQELGVPAFDNQDARRILQATSMR